ncbi:MAG: hypothetical protein OEM23_04575 [Gemmatimonadota bacterium]|nr:hypothetical protein [Gemmatimonadota bacterium]
MGLFEFLMVLLSVVIGLGLAEILTGAANLLRARHTVRFHWFHPLFQLGVFFALLQQWWEFWDMEGMDDISFLAVLAVLAPPVFLFLIANLLNPREPEGVDLEEYYFKQAPFLWGLVIAATVEGFLQPLVFGESVFHLSNLSGIPMVGICVVLAVSKKPRVHWILGPTILVIVLLDTILANPAISTG